MFPMMLDLVHAGPVMATAFFASSVEAVVLEGFAVIAIVIGIGAGGGTLVPATLGAIAACLLVAVAAALLNRPLARVPENALKFVVGIMVSAFGLFWFGEGIGLHWPYGDAAIPGVMLVLLLASALGIHAIRIVRGRALGAGA